MGPGKKNWHVSYYLGCFHARSTHGCRIKEEDFGRFRSMEECDIPRLEVVLMEKDGSRMLEDGCEIEQCDGMGSHTDNSL